MGEGLVSRHTYRDLKVRWQLVEGAVGRRALRRLITTSGSWSTIHLPKRGVLVRSKSAVRIELALLGAEIFTFKVVTFKAYLTLSLPWLMTC